MQRPRLWGARPKGCCLASEMDPSFRPLHLQANSFFSGVINNDLNECTFILQGVTDINSPLEKGGDTALNLDILEFKNYVKKKTELNLDLFPFYQLHLFRKLKLNGYWNRLGCDQRMINSFAKDLGKPEDVVVCIEDYQKGKNKKFCEPIKGKGIRALFRRHGCRLF